MAYFSEDEYNIMVEELLREPCCFDKMLEIAEDVLTPYVIRRCWGNLEGLHEEILQEIYINMVKYCVTHYLRQEEREKSADKFQAWMYTTANNKIIDYARDLKRLRDADNAGWVQKTIENQPSPSDSEEIQKQITTAVGKVMKSKAEPHVILTWLLVSILILSLNEEKKNVNHIVTMYFMKKTLDEILDYIEKVSKKFWWEPVKAADIQNLRERLDKQHSDGRRLGEVRYEEFEMKKGMLSAISNWMNRMNDTAAGKNSDKKDKKDKKKKKSDGEMEETDDGASHD